MIAQRLDKLPAALVNALTAEQRALIRSQATAQRGIEREKQKTAQAQQKAAEAQQKVIEAQRQAAEAQRQAAEAIAPVTVKVVRMRPEEIAAAVDNKRVRRRF